MSTLTQKDLLSTEWSHRVDVATLPGGPYQLTIEASAQQSKDMARRMNVKAVEGLRADVTLERTQGSHTVRVSGTVQGRVIQPCVVTLADTVQAIEEPFEAWFADKEAAISLSRVRHDKMSRYLDAEVPMLEEHEDPEPIVDGQIDVGEVAAQYLSLAVNPYPRAEGVNAEITDKILEEEGVAEQSRNPFEALKKWKEDRKRPHKH